MASAAPTTLAEALQQIQQMQQAGTGLQTQLVAAQQQIAALALAATGGAASSSSSSAPLVAAQQPRMPFMRIAAPPNYDGSIGALDKWLVTIMQQFDFYTIVADADRIRYSAALWTNAALDWWSQLAVRPATWLDLVTALRARFQPIDSEKSIRTKLLALQQGKGAGSAAAYVSAFTRLVGGVALTMSPQDQLHQFVRGLNPAIASMVSLYDAKTLEDAKNLAVRVGAAATASDRKSVV